MSSLRLFKVAMCGLDITTNFSVMHTLLGKVSVCCCVCENFPRDCKDFLLFHQFREVFTELGVIFPSLMFK